MTVIQTVDGRMLPSRGPALSVRNGTNTTVMPGRGSVPLSGGTTISYEAIYEGHPACAAVVNKLRDQLSTLPLRTYHRDDLDAPTPWLDHPVARLLGQPMPRFGPSSWKQWLAFPWLLHGNGLIAKYRAPSGDGAPTHLMPVSWPFVSAYAALGCPVEWWSTWQTGDERAFQVADAIHLAWWSTSDHGLGVSPLKQLAMTVQLEDSARRYMAASFTNGGRPSGAISPPDGFVYKDGQREELTEEIRKKFQGADNAGMVALLAAGFTWTTLSHTAVEAELIAARKINREEIAMVYDVPPPMIGDLEHGTYSNVEELHKILYVTTLRPRLVLMEEVLQAQLIDSEPAWADDGVFVRFDLREVLRGSPREELDALSVAYNSGVATLNEVRKDLGYKKVDDPAADMPHIQANNMAPIGDVRATYVPAGPVPPASDVPATDPPVMD